MKFYKFFGYQAYWTLYYKSKEDGGKFAGRFIGEELLEEWNKCEVEIRFRGERANIKPDIMDFGGTAGVVLSSGAKEYMEDLILPYGELLPVELDGETLYIINPTVVLDCIDYNKSIKEKKPPLYNEKIIKYELKKEINYPPIFRIKNEVRYLIVSDVFVNRLKENDFVGYTLKEIWDSNE